MADGGVSGRIDGRYVWTGDDLGTATDWVLHWSPAALDEMDGILAEVRRRKLGLYDIKPGDFPLSSIADELSTIRSMLRDGRGLVLMRGLPTEKYAQEEIETIFWILGAALGSCLAQSYKGDRLGHVVDIGEPGRYYTVGGALEMHMDPVDVVGLLCLRKAIRGGESRVASFSTVHNIIASERPDMLPVLYRGFHYSSRQIDRMADSPVVTPHRVPVFAELDGMPTCFYLPQAIRAATTQGGIVLSDEEREAMPLVDAVASRPGIYLEMDLEPGDIQFLNNRLVLHGRADYDDPPDPGLKRHMLRLWLTMPGWPPRRADMDFLTEHDRAARAAGAGTRD